MNSKDQYVVDIFGDDGLFYIFRFGIPILHFEDIKLANSVAYWLNQECEETNHKKEVISELKLKDYNRRKYQRVLEAKIRRLKDRVKVFEKNCSPSELQEIHDKKRWKKQSQKQL